MEDFKFCILREEKDIIEYEKGLYNAFYYQKNDSWDINNYKKINDNRLKSIIDYKDLDVVVLKNNENILFAGQINYNYSNEMMFEKQGFKIKKHKGICEGFNLFSTSLVNSNNYFNVSSLFVDNILTHLQKMNIEKIYTYVYRDFKAFISMLGFNMVTKIIKDDKKVYLYEQIIISQKTKE